MNAPAIKINTPVREQVSKEEWEVRVDLAACYRLMHEFGMVEMVANHISARVPGTTNEFLINPYPHAGRHGGVRHEMRNHADRPVLDALH